MEDFLPAFASVMSRAAMEDICGPAAKMEPGRQVESLVEGRFELRSALFSTEGLRSGDKDDLVSFLFGPGDDLLCGFCCAARETPARVETRKSVANQQSHF